MDTPESERYRGFSDESSAETKFYSEAAAEEASDIPKGYHMVDACRNCRHEKANIYWSRMECDMKPYEEHHFVPDPNGKCDYYGRR